MKTLYIALLGAMFVLFPQSSYSHEYPIKDSDANIVGHVIDKHTKEHLPYITVMLKGTTIGATTDATGHYHLVNLPEGNFTMAVSAIGYKAITREVNLKKGKTLEMNFEIEEDLISLEGVVVSANRSEPTRRMALAWAYLVGEPKDIYVKPIKILKHGRRDKSLVKYGFEEISNVLFRPTYISKFDAFKFLSCP